MTDDDHAAAIRASITDAVRYALGHAASVIDDYAAQTPAARPFCDDLVTILRHHSAGFGQEEKP